MAPCVHCRRGVLCAHCTSPVRSFGLGRTSLWVAAQVPVDTILRVSIPPLTKNHQQYTFFRSCQPVFDDERVEITSYAATFCHLSLVPPFNACLADRPRAVQGKEWLKDMADRQTWLLVHTKLLADKPWQSQHAHEHICKQEALVSWICVHHYLR